VETYAEAVGLKLPVSWRVSERLVYLTSDEHGTLEEWMTASTAFWPIRAASLAWLTRRPAMGGPQPS
jgi:hypothetical protein